MIFLLMLTSAFRYTTTWRFSNPTVQTFTISTPEDDTYAFSAAEFSAVFSDTVDNSLEGVVIENLPDEGTLTFQDASVTIGDTLPLGSLTSLVYMPATNYNGVDTLTWWATTQLGTNTDTVSCLLKVTAVNDAPNMGNSSRLTNEDELLQIAVASLEASAFNDIDGDSPQIVRFDTLPGNGEVSLLVNDSWTLAQTGVEYDWNLTDSIRYMPNLNFFGTDRWFWTMADGTLFANQSGRVTVTVLSVEDVPTVNSITVRGTTNGVFGIDFSEFKASFDDPEGDTLQFVEILSLPDSGLLMVADSALAVNDQLSLESSFTVNYTPNSDFAGTDGFTWKAISTGDEVTATISFIVVAPNAAPLVPNRDTVSQEDVIFDLPISYFTELATDPDGDVLDSIWFTQLSDVGVWTYGGLSGDTIQENVAYALSDLNDLTYLPELHFFGDVDLAYQLSDTEGNISQTATLELTLESVNDVPGRFGFEGIPDDTLRWSGGTFTVRWTEAEDVDLGDTVQYTWYLNLRDTLIAVETGTRQSVSVTLDTAFLQDPDIFLMWVVASDGEAESEAPGKIFKVLNPTITGLDDNTSVNWKVYPNPTHDGVLVSIPEGMTFGKITCWSLQGQHLQSWELTTDELRQSTWYTTLRRLGASTVLLHARFQSNEGQWVDYEQTLRLE